MSNKAFLPATPGDTDYGIKNQQEATSNACTI